MTAEQATLQEINMSAEQLSERTRKMDELAKGAGDETRRPAYTPIVVQKGENLAQAIGRTTRKRRSDAGIPRKRPPVPAAAAPAGSITTAQAQELAKLIQEKESRHVEWEAAVETAGYKRAVFDEARAALDDFIAALTAK